MAYTGITLVTGAAGFMGSHLVEHLVSLGVRVRATARPRRDTSFFDRLGVEFVPADLTKPETLPPLFAGGVDRVFHLGAICNFSTPYEKLHPTNVAGVEHLTGLALKAGVKRYIHVGSTSVYGPYRGVPFREDAPRTPQDDYGRSKRDGEDVVWRRMREGLHAIITRPCTVYGPRCNDGAGKAFSRPSSIAAIPGHGRQRLSNIRRRPSARNRPPFISPWGSSRLCPGSTAGWPPAGAASPTWSTTPSAISMTTTSWTTQSSRPRATG